MLGQWCRFRGRYHTARFQEDRDHSHREGRGKIRLVKAIVREVKDNSREVKDNSREVKDNSKEVKGNSKEVKDRIIT